MSESTSVVETTATASDEDELDLTPHDVVRPLPPPFMNVRTRIRSVLALYAWELVASLVVATPYHGLVRAAFGGHPDGDALVFQPGGHGIVELFGNTGLGMPVATRSTLAMLVVATIALQLPLGALLASFVTGRGAERRALPQRALFRDAASAFAPLATVLVVTSIVQAVLLGGASFAAGAASRFAAPRFEDLVAFRSAVVAAAPFVVLALLVSPLADLSRVVVVRGTVRTAGDASVLSLVRAAIGALVGLPRRVKIAALGAWALRAVAGAALVVAAAAVVGHVRAAAVAWLVHQACVLARTFLRASWLAYASRAVAVAGDV